MKGFKKGCICSTINGTNDSCGMAVRRMEMCEEDEGSYCEDGDNNTDW